VREVRQDAELDLRGVSGEQPVVGVGEVRLHRGRDLAVELQRLLRPRRVERARGKLGGAQQAAGFAHDPALAAGMEQAGVDGPPRIGIFTDV